LVSCAYGNLRGKVFTGKDNGRGNYQDSSIGILLRMQIPVHGVQGCVEKRSRSSRSSHHRVHQCSADVKTLG